MATEASCAWWRNVLREPVDASSLIGVRLALGALICAGAIRFWAKGWVQELLLNDGIRLTYYGFAWVPHPGELGCQVLLTVTALAGFAMCFGRWGRAPLVVAFVSFTWLELIEASTYLNHYYFVTALLLLLCVLPQLPPTSTLLSSKEHAPCVPRATLWAVRTQVAAVYVFAGAAKLNPDWLLRAEPLRTWLMVRSELPVLGPLLTHEMTAYAFSICGAAYDLTIVAWLSWRKTRAFAWTAVVVFHVLTAALFRIGLFPWIMIALSCVFFEPDWLRRVVASVRDRWRHEPRGSWPPTPDSGSPSTAPASGAAEMATFTRGQGAVVGLLLCLQLLFPLRQWLYAGNRMWTEQGFRFAWNVMLMEKAGHMEFVVRDGNTGRSYRTDGEMLLTPLQRKMASTQPDFLLQVAHEIGRRSSSRGYQNVRVYGDVWVSLNGRRRRRFVDPSVDLMHVHDGFAPRTWLLPMNDGER